MCVQYVVYMQFHVRTGGFSVAVISSKSESASGTVSGPSLSSGKLLWKCLMKIRGKAVRGQKVHS